MRKNTKACWQTEGKISRCLSSKINENTCVSSRLLCSTYCWENLILFKICFFSIRVNKYWVVINICIHHLCLILCIFRLEGKYDVCINAIYTVYTFSSIDVFVKYQMQIRVFTRGKIKGKYSMPPLKDFTTGVKFNSAREKEFDLWSNSFIKCTDW